LQEALEALLVDPLLAAAQSGDDAVDVSSFAAQVRFRVQDTTTAPAVSAWNA